MPLFIPEWVKVSGKNLHIKRVLNALDVDCVIRRPLKFDACPVDFFIEQPLKGWMAVAINDVPFAELDPAQLFKPELQIAFEQQLSEMQKLGCEENDEENAERPLAALVLLWACSGMWMWWEMKVTRVAGAVALAAGVALFAAFLATI